MTLIAAKYGASFERDPWTGTVKLLNAERVPRNIKDGLQSHALDLEALLAEHRPIDPVTIAEQLVAGQVFR